MMKKITEKLKGVLSEEDLSAFQSEVQQVISEKVALKVEDEVTRLEKLANDYCEKQISEQVEVKTKALSEKYESDLEALESNIVEKLDQYLDLEINEKISDKLLQGVAINETYAPIIAGIQNLFENKYVALDSEGSKLLSDMKKQVETLDAKLMQKVNENIELNALCEKAAIKTILAEKTADLTPSQRSKTVMFFEGKDFTNIHKNIDSYVSMISEEVSVPSQSRTLTETTEVVSDTDSTKDLVTESFKKEETISVIDAFLMRGSKFMYAE